MNVTFFFSDDCSNSKSREAWGRTPWQRRGKPFYVVWYWRALRCPDFSSMGGEKKRFTKKFLGKAFPAPRHPPLTVPTLHILARPPLPPPSPDRPTSSSGEGGCESWRLFDFISPKFSLRKKEKIKNKDKNIFLIIILFQIVCWQKLTKVEILPFTKLMMERERVRMYEGGASLTCDSSFFFLLSKGLLFRIKWGWRARLCDLQESCCSFCCCCCCCCSFLPFLPSHRSWGKKTKQKTPGGGFFFFLFSSFLFFSFRA